MKTLKRKRPGPKKRRPKRMQPDDFRVDKLLRLARKIWGPDRLNLTGILVRMGKGYGDLCLIARERGNITSFMPITADEAESIRELQKELGNIIFSTIRWCDDLGFSPEACISAAIEAQRRYAANRTKPR